MRSASNFLAGYRKASCNPDLFRAGQNKEVALVDLALHFLSEFLPRENVAVIPFLLSGYSKLIKDDSQFLRAIQNLRHYCPSFCSAYAWTAAAEVHSDFPEINRAYRIEATLPVRRSAASDAILEHLHTALHDCAPHAMRSVTFATPGLGTVYVDHRKTKLEYRIPFRSEAEVSSKRYELIRRTHNPPIAVRWSALVDVAGMVDRTEASPDWFAATGLKPLNLARRLEKIKLHAVDHALFRDGILSIEGIRHLVGMLSSGKSGLVLALLLTLARREYGKRILVLSPDTTAAALLSCRLKAHGISSTVLSSFRNRDEHLSAIHWHQAMTCKSGWSMEGVGHLVRDFQVACPLDGHQLELNAVTGIDHGDLRFPLMDEKPCHSIEQEGSVRVDEDEQVSSESRNRKRTRSCPLFSCCPAQSQQRSAVEAQVIVMTAPAFLMMNPDDNVLAESMSFPELAQFDRDLVIVDEADSVQRVFDEHFSIQAPIMGGEGSYLPQSALSLHAAVQQEGGAQYVSRMNVAWQNRLSRLGIAVSGLYSLLLNRWHDMSGFNLDTEFTAATIFCQLWKTRADKLRGTRDSRLIGETEAAFQKILRMTGQLSTLDEPDPFSRDDQEISEMNVVNRDAVAQALVSLRADLRNGVSWRALLERTIATLSEPLREFNIFEHETGEDVRRRRATERNALAILSALYADIVLSDFNFLIRNQPSVSSAFQLEEYALLNETRHFSRHYRALIPETPGGNAFGLVYEHAAETGGPRGNLKVVSNAGVGRYLLTNLHSLLESDNQAGPHVLLLSGTSWAGGQMTAPAAASPHQSVVELPRALPSIGIASPSYDVQVPIAAYLDQPEEEREQLKRSIFEFLPVPDSDGTAIAISGSKPEMRRMKLKQIAEYLVGGNGLHTRIELQWLKNENAWGKDFMDDRRRAIFVVQSFADGIVVANAIRRQIDVGNAPNHQIYALVSDDEVRSNVTKDRQSRLASGVVALPRSLVEDFGSSPEGSILVVPLVLISRGHNILNRNSVAAVSSIYFLHRPHPRPDDRSAPVGLVNRFALDCLGGRISELCDVTVPMQGRLLRSLGRMICRRALASRGGYSTMTAEEQARFAWDLVPPLWQTIGRGIRSGVPVYGGFVDAKFSPASFAGEVDNADSSCLLKVFEVLRDAVDPALNADWQIAEKLYGPFYECLDRMFHANRLSDRSESRVMTAAAG